MNLKWLFLLFLITSLFGCKKGAGEFAIKGTITDVTFGTGLNGATIELYKVPVASNNEFLVESKTLGTDGSYSFTVPREKMEKYLIRVNKNLYFPIESSIYYSTLNVESDNIRNFSTNAKSWVELKFLNNNPLPNDHLRYIKQQGYSGCMECCPITEQDYYGAVDTSIYCVNLGNTVYSIYYWIIGSNNQGLLKATTTPFDTTQIYLEY
jgi:hypothetical protein